MKKLLCTAFSLFCFAAAAVAGIGTEDSPFTVSEAVKNKDTASDYWVKGYIVGEMYEYSGGTYYYELAPPFQGKTAYLIADDINELDIAKCMPVELKSRTDDYNLEENPQYWRKELLICGKIKSYFAMPGVKDLAELRILSSRPLEDETRYWNFYEDLDAKKAYVPVSETNTFAGGTYTGEGYHTNDIKIWKFRGATLGDTGKDQKWGRAAARIRLTEGASGDAGYIQMEEDKPDGIGVVRFWAGNYEEDSSGGALALYVSDDEGSSWQRAGRSQSISSKWKEYQFQINKEGSLRLRIAKDETGSKGINVDNIRISDYYTRHSNTPQHHDDTDFSYYTNGLGVFINLQNAANTVEVYSITGRCVWAEKNAAGRVFAPLQAGIYILRINSRNFKIAVP